ncbi:MAG: hypothetical protein L3I99_07585 [Sulfurimonas sp.]|nr:hypothetical protein [Sulfurimonas sp.]
MQEKNYEIKLHDIKTIVDVQEYSLYYFLGISLIALMLVCVIIFFSYRWFKNKNSYNQRKEYFKLLDTLDFSDTKKTAYAITLYGDLFKNDSDKHQQIFEKIITQLEQYKYKKNINKFDEEIIKNIKNYKDMINV